MTSKSIVAIDSDSEDESSSSGGHLAQTKNVQTFSEFVRGWEEHDDGYWIVEFDGDIIGMAGVEPQLFLKEKLESLLPPVSHCLGQWVSPSKQRRKR